MDRRTVLFSGAALTAVAISNTAMAQAPYPELPRNMDPFALMSGEPLFVEGPLAENPVSRNFGLIPDLAQPLDITFETQDGARRFSDLTGKVRLLALWAEWCPPCMQELGEMAALQTAHGDDTFEILAVTSATRLKLDEAIEVVADAGAAALPVWLESRGDRLLRAVAMPSNPPPGREGRYSIPCVVLVDEKGGVRGHMMGLKSAPTPPIPAAAPPPAATSGDVVIDSVVESHVMADGEKVPPSIWSLPAAGTFIDALKAGALSQV